MTALLSTTQAMITERLTVRPWRIDDAPAALGVYGHLEVVRWLSPGMDRVPDLAAMRLLLQQWIAEGARLAAPAGRWPPGPSATTSTRPRSTSTPICR